MKEEIKNALEKATPGPWNKEGVEVWRRGTGYNTSEDAHIWICDAFNGEDAHLIANAPTYLKWQNERIEKLEKEHERLVNIARGCKDYGGGYRHDADLFEAFQHGIQTVINALEAATKKDDSQLKVLEALGKEE